MCAHLNGTALASEVRQGAQKPLVDRVRLVTGEDPNRVLSVAEAIERADPDVGVHEEDFGFRLANELACL